MLLGSALALMPAPAGAQFDAPRARVTEDLRISGADQDLVPISWLFVAADGRIGVTQPKDGKAIIFMPNGKRAFAVGGIGDGPGEFRAMALGGWRGDTIWLSENTSRRISTFTSSGKLIRTQSFANVIVGPGAKGIPAGLSNYAPLALYADGSVLANRGAPSRDSPPTIMVHVSARGEVNRVLLQHPRAGTVVIQNKNGGTTYTSAPFVNGTADFFAADGNRLGYFEMTPTQTGGTIRTIIVSAAGDTLISRSIPFIGTRISQQTKDSAIADRLRQRQGPATVVGPGGVPQKATQRVDASELADYEAALRDKMPVFYAPIVSAKLGLDNTIWVHTRVTGPEAEWVMLSERGGPEFTISLPPKTRLMQASRSTIWAVQLDDDDIPSVVRYRIDRAR